MFTHPHYKLPDGKLISKSRVDAARELLNEVIAGGCTLVELTDSELFASGDKFEAIKRFRDKHNTGVVDAKQAIEYLRGENISPIF